MEVLCSVIAANEQPFRSNSFVSISLGNSVSRIRAIIPLSGVCQTVLSNMLSGKPGLKLVFVIFFLRPRASLCHGRRLANLR